MKFYLAPMEAITGYVFRNAYHECFQDFDKYFTPFIMPNQYHCFNTREYQDILPEHNQGMYTVPQILTKQADDFVRTARELYDMGYEEVNLNLGCPSRTVVSKGRGAGLLAEPEKLERFLDEIFGRRVGKISIKTRIGIEEPEEFEELLSVYNKFPLEELIIHPRLQRDYYKNHPNLEVFGAALEQSACPVCYNGDLFDEEEYGNFTERFPNVEAVMLGRGILMNPGLISALCGRKTGKEELKKFHGLVLAGYEKNMQGDRNVLFKMKEFWSYMADSFADSKKMAKKIKKAERLPVYKAIVEELFATLELVEPGKGQNRR